MWYYHLYVESKNQMNEYNTVSQKQNKLIVTSRKRYGEKGQDKGRWLKGTNYYVYNIIGKMQGYIVQHRKYS